MFGISKVSRKAKTALQLPFREKLWFCLMYPLTGIARAAILVFPFRIYCRSMGVLLNERAYEASETPENQTLALRLGKTCSLTSKYTPWESKCLVQAIVVRLFMKYYRISCVLVVGLSKADKVFEPMKAHAWVSVGGRAIVGQKGHQAFTPLAKFGTNISISN